MTSWATQDSNEPMHAAARQVGCPHPMYAARTSGGRRLAKTLQHCRSEKVALDLGLTIISLICHKLAVTTVPERRAIEGVDRLQLRRLLAVL
jgi:hypothetical protein